MKFVNPDAASLECLMALVSIRKDYISKNINHTLIYVTIAPQLFMEACL